jgi:hypothetical protein
MRIIEREFDTFAEDHYPNMELVRAWADCKIWSAGVEQRLLILMDSASRRLALFEYNSLSEREQDIQLVLNLPDDGATGTIPAFLGPRPPRRPASAALPLPVQIEDDENSVELYGM